jgi:hypothetical protein
MMKNVWGQQDKPFLSFFDIYSLMGGTEKILICCEGQAEEKMPPWPSAETILLRPGEGAGLILLQGGEGLRRHSFNVNIIKGVDGRSFKPIISYVTLTYTTFSRENVTLRGIKTKVWIHLDRLDSFEV